MFCGMVCVSLTAVADGNKTSATVSPQVVHVAVTGDDRNPGTGAEPVARLRKAYELVKNSETPSEIITHAGTYEGGVALPEKKGPNPLARAEGPHDPRSDPSEDPQGVGLAEIEHCLGEARCPRGL